ncbi:MAG: hypothetical protein AAGH73_00195 [Pseudomonadota bacterium]
MSAVLLAAPQSAPDHSPAPEETAFAALRPLLNRVRFLAQTCRAEARLDLAVACAAIHACPEKSLDAVATSMVRVLSEAVGSHVSFRAPGAADMSFDEEWLLRVVDRAIAKDTMSVEFLLRRRVPARNHHAFRSIVRAVSTILRP